GQAGEVVWWLPHVASCYRCLCSERYKAFEQGKMIDQVSDGADILAVQFLDSLTAMIVIAILTRGSDNRYGRLIDELGNRNFLQVKIDPSWTIGGVDPVAKYLGVHKDSNAYIGFSTVARRDPDAGGTCPDCQKYRPVA